jgi:hypothetical protein
VSRSIASMALAAGLAASGLGLAVAAHAQDASASAGTPPAWNTLVQCAQTASAKDRLACYDSAMRAAGYAPNPEAVAAEHRKTFGLTVPTINMGGHKKKEEGKLPSAPTIEENPNEVEVTVDQVAITQPVGKVIIFTTDGQIWRQTDTTTVNSYPKEGDTIRIHREALGGYFCDVNKYQAVACVRAK